MKELELGSLSGRKIVLGVTGSIAAYKSPLILRQLTAAGASVRVILTPSAERFVGSAVFRGLGVEVFTDMWEGQGERHVALAAWADLILVAPATANTLARMCQGRADDLLCATLLCSTVPVVVAPAMHPSMWNHPATKANSDVLFERGVRFLGPIFGKVASGDEGTGRMEEPTRLAQAVLQMLTPEGGKLKGKHLVVTAGPTREAIDPVRALTNISSGKMGYAIAGKALDEGARVTLISGPVSIPPPTGAKVVHVESAFEMQGAMSDALGGQLDQADALIMAAAVADFRPESAEVEKIKRSGEGMQLKLLPNPDLLAEVGRRRTGQRPVLIGFALETKKGEELLALGRNKLIQKRVDMIVANSASDSLGQDDNVVRLVSARDCTPLDRMSKFDVAAEILDWLSRRLSEPDNSEETP